MYKRQELTDPETEKHVTNEAPAAANPAAPEAHRADAVAIAELCQLAGHPELTAAFLAKGCLLYTSRCV